MRGDLRPVLGAMRAGEFAARWGVPPARTEEESVLPFVTIARQAGAGGRALGHSLADALNATLASDDTPRWRAYDRELVEKIAADHQLAHSLIETLEEQGYHWLRDLLGGLSFEGPSETAVFHRAVATIRVLAQRGRVVLVGRGGVFITKDMPAGVHVHLVAPRGHRVRQLAGAFKLSLVDAEREVTRIDRGRASFYRTFFPNQVFDDLAFDVTFNTAMVEEATMVGALRPLVEARTAALRQPSAGTTPR